MENNDKNLDETKIFKPINDTADDTLEIPSFGKKQDLEATKVIQLDQEELVDNGSENLKAAEAELNELLQQQEGNNQGGNGDDDSNMAKKKKGKRSGHEKFNIFLMVSTSLMVVGIIMAATLWLILTAGKPELDMDALANLNGSTLLDKDGELFFDLSSLSGDGATFDDIGFDNISQNVVDAFISIEDARFFKHKGFDVPRFTKSIFKNIKDRDFTQGGSTITMQLVKTSYLTADKDVSRKAREISLSLELEKKISKEDIFEYYVNKINYGAGNSRGLESAAKYYFDKSAAELTISESALLAGVINAPFAYSPLRNLELSYIRRDRVIDLMAYHGYISEHEAKLAKAVKIENQLTNESSAKVTITDNPYIDYANAVVDEIQDVLDIDILVTPITIHTNMDPAMQETVSKIQKEESFTYPDAYIQSGIVLGDNNTGEVVAIGAGRQTDEEFGIRGFNRATDMFQQPGSVTKPLLSYALAFEHLGWATSHVVEDKPVQYAGTDKYLGNADGLYRGEVRLKDAVASSLNTPAYLALLDVEDKIGRDRVAKYLEESLNFSRVTPELYDTQYSIGGSSFLISPLELFGAQAVMMNGGYYIKPHLVNQVVTSDGKVIKDEFEVEKTKVISEETTYLVSELENYNVNAGIINRMEVLAGKSYPVYAKTGTTDYGDTAVHLGIPVGAGKDQWMMASSRNYTSIVWMGYDKPEAGKETYWTNVKYNSNPLGYMNNILLDAVHEGKENPGSVERPSGIADITHVLSTFPYANPVPNMDDQYITSGLINRKFLNLVDLDNAGIAIEKLDSFAADLSADGQDKILTIKWSDYPDDGAVKGASYDISLGAISATGTRLFDPSWIFGPVKYHATVYVDGKEVDSITSESSTATKTLSVPNGSTVKVCGYYANNSQEGPETCVDVTNPTTDQLVQIPQFNTKEDINTFIAKYNLNSSLWKTGDPTPTTDPALVGTVAFVHYNGVPITGFEYTNEQLKTMSFTISFYELQKEEPEKPEGGRDGRQAYLDHRLRLLKS